MLFCRKSSPIRAAERWSRPDPEGDLRRGSNAPCVESPWDAAFWSALTAAGEAPSPAANAGSGRRHRRPNGLSPAVRRRIERGGEPAGPAARFDHSRRKPGSRPVWTNRADWSAGEESGQSGQQKNRCFERTVHLRETYLCWSYGQFHALARTARTWKESPLGRSPWNSTGCNRVLTGTGTGPNVSSSLSRGVFRRGVWPRGYFKEVSS